VASRSSKKEFRTSVILTETQFKQVRELAREHDVSIAWVLRQAVVGIALLTLLGIFAAGIATRK